MAQDVVLVAHPTDIAAARAMTRQAAVAIGFDDIAGEELAIVASELASNLVRHAGQGTIRVTTINRGAQTGIQIEAVDRGPGIPDVNRALTDGYSTGGSLGYGLGTVNRLVDELEITSQPGPEGGTQVVSRRWLRVPPTGPDRASPLDFGVASRPYPGYDVNGDDFVIKHWYGNALAGIIDGLGHGLEAHRAASAARHYVESHFDQPLDAILRGTAWACQGTRGVVMALAHFAWAGEVRPTGEAWPDSEIRLAFASIGNIEARGFNREGPLELMVRRGVIGLNAPGAAVTYNRWTAGSLLVLHSDGLHSRWRWQDFPDLATEPAAMTAPKLLRALARDNDDATVMVIRNKTQQPET